MGWWLLLLIAASPRSDLAEAVGLYFDGSPSAAAVRFETLHAERPFDDDVAWWVARTRLDQGEADGALRALAGRSGQNVPSWRFRVLEATALVLLEDTAQARALLEEIVGQVRGTADRAAVLALMGLLQARAGDDAAAADTLREGGPQALDNLDPVLVGRLELAAPFSVRAPSAKGVLEVTRPDGTWRIDLETGLGRPVPEGEAELPAVWRSRPGQRGRPDRCPGSGESWVWTSPEEPLHDRLPGVYRSRGSRVEQLSLTPPAAVDLSPACVGDHVWFVRRLGTHAEVIHLVGGAADAVEVTAGAVATVDARRGPHGGHQVLLGLVVDGRPKVWWIAGPGRDPQPLLVDDQVLLAPRWVP